MATFVGYSTAKWKALKFGTKREMTKELFDVLLKKGYITADKEEEPEKELIASQEPEKETKPSKK